MAELGEKKADERDEVLGKQVAELFSNEGESQEKLEESEVEPSMV